MTTRGFDQVAPPSSLVASMKKPFGLSPLPTSRPRAAPRRPLDAETMFPTRT